MYRRSNTYPPTFASFCDCVVLSKIQDGGKALARQWLQEAVDNREVDFRRGQWEAIDTIVNRKERLLVVERTGWGKSIVYFLSSRLLRQTQRHDALTVVVSPLISLMRNQIEQAERIQVKAVTINYSNNDEWQQSYEVRSAAADCASASRRRRAYVRCVEVNKDILTTWHERRTGLVQSYDRLGIYFLDFKSIVGRPTFVDTD